MFLRENLLQLVKLLVMLLVNCYPTISQRFDNFITLIRLHVKGNVTTNQGSRRPE